MTIDEVIPRGDHEGVSVEDGIIVRGSATNLPTEDSIWLMDKVNDKYAIAGEAEWEADQWDG